MVCFWPQEDGYDPTATLPHRERDIALITAVCRFMADSILTMDKLGNPSAAVGATLFLTVLLSLPHCVCCCCSVVEVCIVSIRADAR